MRVVVVVPPAPVVTWDDASRHLNLGGDVTDQALVEGLIAAATAHIDGPSAPDGGIGRAIGVQTLEARFDLWPPRDCSVELPFPPVIDLVSVKYLDANQVEQTGSLEDFELLGNELVPAGSIFPWEGGSTRREAVRIQYRVGYQEVPAPIKAAILLMVGDLYTNRQTTAVGTSTGLAEIPMSVTVDRLLGPYRVYR